MFKIAEMLAIINKFTNNYNIFYMKMLLQKDTSKRYFEKILSNKQWDSVS